MLQTQKVSSTQEVRRTKYAEPEEASEPANLSGSGSKPSRGFVHFRGEPTSHPFSGGGT